MSVRNVWFCEVSSVRCDDEAAWRRRPHRDELARLYCDAHKRAEVDAGAFEDEFEPIADWEAREFPSKPKTVLEEYKREENR